MSHKARPATRAANPKSTIVKVDAVQHEQISALAHRTRRTTISLYTELLEFGLACRAPIILKRWEEDREALGTKA